MLNTKLINHNFQSYKLEEKDDHDMMATIQLQLETTRGRREKGRLLKGINHNELLKWRDGLFLFMKETSIYYFNPNEKPALLIQLLDTVTSSSKKKAVGQLLQLPNYPGILCSLDGMVHVLSIPTTLDSCLIVSTLSLPSNDEEDFKSSPTVLLDSLIKEETLYLLTLSDAAKKENMPSSSRGRKVPSSSYHVSLLAFKNFQMEEKRMELMGSIRCSEIPNFSRIIDDSSSKDVTFSLVSDGVNEIVLPTPVPETSKSSAEVIKENLPPNISGSSPYSWKQTETDVILTIPLSLPHQEKDVTVLIMKNKISLRSKISASNGLQDGKSRFASLSLLPPSIEDLFSPINPSESAWNIEGEGKVLTVWLAKAFSGRWIQVFQQREGEVEVEESMAEEEVWEFAAKLDKYTEDVEEAETPLADPIDFDNMMQEFAVLFVDTFVSSQQEGCLKRVNGPVSLDAGKLGTVEASNQLLLSSDVDAAIFHFTSLEHVAMFPALAYVHSSKKDALFTIVSADYAHGMIIERERYLYYYLNPGTDSPFSIQRVYDLGVGIVVGVGFHERMIVVLKEDRMVKINLKS